MVITVTTLQLHYKIWTGYMNASDVLSRNPLPSDTSTVREDTEHFINSIISDAVLLSVSLDEIKSETSDPDLCSVIQSVNTNFWDKKLLPALPRPHCEKLHFVKIK